MLNTFSGRVIGPFRSPRSERRPSASNIEETISQIRHALLDTDVVLPVVRSFIATVRGKATGVVTSKVLDPDQRMVKTINNELVKVLGGETHRLDLSRRPAVVMLTGLWGAGKTTLANRLGRWLRIEHNRKVLLAASDLQRPNAANQLQMIDGQARVDMWAPEPGNSVDSPVAVARSGLVWAEEYGYGVVVVDTTRRLDIDEKMIHQAVDIRAVVNLNEMLFVIDAMIGQDTVATTNVFQDRVGLTDVVVSKLDGNTRGGAALPVRGVTGVPIMFASTGGRFRDFEQFHADRTVSRVLDMGNVFTFIEQAERTWDEQQQAEPAEKMSGGSFTLDDFLVQMRQFKRMGLIKRIMGMLPGIGQYRETLEVFDENSMGQIEAIAQSATLAERADIKILDGSRRQRIAHGSGTTVQEINSLVERLEQAHKMMQQVLRGGGVPGMPGMDGMTGIGDGDHKAKCAAKEKSTNKKGRSGSPAKCAAQEREQNQQGQEDKDSSFGVGASRGTRQPGGNSDFEGLAKFPKRPHIA